MSQYMQALVNLTNGPIIYVDYDGSTTPKYRITLLSTPCDQALVGQINIPDNSDPCNYWSKQHSEIQDANGNAIFSFWDDDHNNYIINYISGNNCNTTPQAMPGCSNLGNKASVVIVVGQGASGYTIQALQAVNP